MHIGKVKVCEPISKLVNELEDKGYIAIESGISDFHFHEVFIKMNESPTKPKRDCIEIERIEKIQMNIYMCTCHWSTVTITNDKSIE